MEAKHQSLLYLSYVVMHADGEVQYQENEVLKQVVIQEHIPKEAIAELAKDIASKSLEEIRKKGLNGLIKIGREDQIKTLTWINRMIHADNVINVKEAQFLLYSIKPTDIAFAEIEMEERQPPMI